MFVCPLCSEMRNLFRNIHSKNIPENFNNLKKKIKFCSVNSRSVQ